MRFRTTRQTVAALLALATLGGVYAAQRLTEGGAAPTSTARCLEASLRGPDVPDSHPRLEAAVIQRVNAVRRERGLQALELDGHLAAAARWHSSDMHRRRYFAHDGPGDPFSARLRRYTCAGAVGETLAWGTGGYATAAGIVSLWLASPPHRRIMLSPSMRRVGVGVAGGTFYGNARARITTADYAG